ncbi:ExbD/TolR family protein [Thermodesulfobacteriota bacterium]
MKLVLHTNKKARIEMLPLIDIVFLLLVFFIYAMLSMAVHRGLPVVLPSSATAAITQKPALSVTVKIDGSIYVDKTRVPMNQLKAMLQEKTAGDKDPGVFLFAEKTLSYQKLFQVLDQIRLAGIHRISLQAEVEPQQ